MTFDLGGRAFTRVTAEDEPHVRALQGLLESDAATWALLEGAPPRPDEALHLIDERPPGVPPDRKHLWLATGDAAPDAVIELVEGYPDATTWYVGLIFVAPHARGAGLGATLMRAVAEHARARGGTALRLAVVVENTGARRLYDRLGFAHVARRSRTTWSGLAQECDVLELAL